MRYAISEFSWQSELNKSNIHFRELLLSIVMSMSVRVVCLSVRKDISGTTHAILGENVLEKPNTPVTC